MPDNENRITLCLAMDTADENLSRIGANAAHIEPEQAKAAYEAMVSQAQPTLARADGTPMTGDTREFVLSEAAEHGYRILKLFPRDRDGMRRLTPLPSPGIDLRKEFGFVGEVSPEAEAEIAKLPNGGTIPRS